MAGVNSLWLLPALSRAPGMGAQPFLVGWSEPDPRLVLGQLLWTAPNQAVLWFSSQYYEMSYGLNIEMHKQVRAVGAGPAAGEGGEEAEVGGFVGKLSPLSPCSSTGVGDVTQLHARDWLAKGSSSCQDVLLSSPSLPSQR